MQYGKKIKQVNGEKVTKVEEEGELWNWAVAVRGVISDEVTF